MVSKPVAVIFDFDGVVVDSLSVHLQAWRDAFQELYGAALDDTTGLPGRSTGVIANILAQRVGKPTTADLLADLKRTRLKEQTNQIVPLPGALEAFVWLRENKIPFGIASNAPRSFILYTLNNYGVILDKVFGSEDVTRPKPEPDIFLKCAKSLDIKFTEHDQIIVFEDSTHGIKAAVTAGMYPIGITSQNSEEVLLSAGAKVACSHIQDAMNRGWFSELP